jgi:hypothetical protein
MDEPAANSNHILLSDGPLVGTVFAGRECVYRPNLLIQKRFDVEIASIYVRADCPADSYCVYENRGGQWKFSGMAKTMPVTPMKAGVLL